MKIARIIVLGIAGIAGIGAAILSTSQNSTPPTAPEPAVQTEMTEILVAKSDLGIGDRISPQNVQWEPWPTTATSDQYVRKPAGIDQISGAVVRTPFVGGEPIRQTKLIKADGAGYIAAMLPSGMRAMQIEISAETAAVGFILPKDRVDLILTRTDRSPTGVDEFSSETLLTNVPVLAIDQNIEEKNGQHVVPGKFATLELTLRQAETVALARRLGTLSLVLRSLAESDQRAGIDEASRRDVIRIVRFGTATRF
jgi:pilus assembly protein CpaB